MHKGLVRAVIFIVCFVHAQRIGQGCFFHCVSFVHAQRVGQGCLFSLCVLYMHKGLVRAIYFHCELCTRTKGWSGLFIFIV
jgi:hypothetical protein